MAAVPSAVDGTAYASGDSAERAQTIQTPPGGDAQLHVTTHTTVYFESQGRGTRASKPLMICQFSSSLIVSPR